MEKVKLFTDTATTKKKQIMFYKEKSFSRWNARMTSIIKTHICRHTGTFLSIH